MRAGRSRGPEERHQRSQPRKHEVGARHARMQLEATAIDPGDGEAEGFAAHHVGELRLPGVVDLAERDPGPIDEIPEEPAVGLVTAGPLRRAHEIEGAPEGRHGEEIVVDVGHEGEPVARGQPLEGGRHVGREGEAGKGVEVALDQATIAARDAKVPEGLIEGPAADLLVGPVGLAVMGDVELLPVVPERARIQVRNAHVGQDGPEHRRGAARRVDESAVDVEGQQRGQRPITWRTAASTRAGSPSRWMGGAREGGGFLMPAPVRIITTRVPASTSPASFIWQSAASAAAASGPVQMPSSRARRRWASTMALSLTAWGRPPVSRMIRSIWRPAKGPGTRRPGASVTGFSQSVVVSALSSHAFTSGAQPSACTAMKRG